MYILVDRNTEYALKVSALIIIREAFVFTAMPNISNKHNIICFNLETFIL